MQPGRLARGAYTFLPVVAVVGAAIIVRSLSWLNNDSSGLISFAERLLDGARPYVDFREVNPPASLLLYLPDIVVGRWLTLTPEAVLAIELFVAAFVSLWLTARILRAASLLTVRECLVLASPAIAILLILPEHVFGQREHIAMIAILPMLASYTSRAANKPVPPVSAIIAGIGGGIATCIKPHFALALLIPLAYVARLCRRQPKAILSLLFSPENIAAVFVAAAYVVIVVRFFPLYLQVMLPILETVYVPARLPWLDLLRTQSVILVLQAVAAAIIIGPRLFLRPFPLVFTMAAAGFLTSILIQGKGWPYHGYPAIALMLLILCAITVKRWPEMRQSRSIVPWSACVIVLVGGLYVISTLWFWPLTWYPQFVSTVARLAPSHPKIASVCGGTQFLFPLVRIVHGTAVDDVLWVNDAVIALRRYDEIDPARLKLVERYAEDESRNFNRAIAEQRPDILVVCPGWKEWALAQPDYARTLSRFHPAATLETSEVWLPN